MSDGRREDEWDRASPVLAFLFNHWRDPKTTSEVPLDHFSPFAQHGRGGHRRPPGAVPLTKKTLHDLKPMFQRRARR